MKEFYKNKTTIKFSDDLLKLKGISLNTSFIEPRCFNNPLKLVKLWLNDRSFLFKKIPFVPFEKIEEISNSYINSIYDKTSFISPLDIPILYVNQRKDYGCFTPIYYEKDENNYELFFTEIRLNNKRTIYTPFQYLHELIHVNIENNDSSINDYIDYELFPILFEFLLSSDLGENVFLFNSSYRISQVYNFIDMLQYEDSLINIYASSYLSSILIAYELILIYKGGNQIIKKEFLNDIKTILNETNDISWLLKKYNISYNIALESFLERRLKM